jgi:hypothetical protein
MISLGKKVGEPPMVKVEKVKNTPQGLMPIAFCTFGTAKAVPFQNLTFTTHS